MRHPFPFRETEDRVAATSTTTERLMIMKNDLDMAISHSREALEKSRDAIRRVLESVCSRRDAVG
jgi:hypothetical protein